MPSKIGMAMFMGLSLQCVDDAVGSIRRDGCRQRSRRRRASLPAAKMSPVLSRGDAYRARKRAMHGLHGAEATAPRDLREAPLRGLEEPSRAFHPLRLDVAGGRDADLAAERSGEVARAHARA